MRGREPTSPRERACRKSGANNNRIHENTNKNHTRRSQRDCQLYKACLLNQTRMAFERLFTTCTVIHTLHDANTENRSTHAATCTHTLNICTRVSSNLATHLRTFARLDACTHLYVRDTQPHVCYTSCSLPDGR